MIRRSFKVTLLEDAAISAAAVSTGAHRCLTYIPGGKFLGFAAAAYDTFGADAWDVFHSGRMRFSHAYPLHGDVRSLPLASVWTEGGWCEAGEPPHKGDRDNFFAGGVVVRPRFVRRQKTARDRALRGAPREGQFFDVRALARRQVFAFSLIADPRLSTAVERVSALLTAGPLSVGRSRSAEFGLLECEEIDLPAPVFPGHESLIGKKNLLLYCTSPIDAGLVAEADLASIFHLPCGWKLTPPFPRRRKLVGFNSHRRMFTTERNLIEQGSVLKFEGPALTEPEAQSLVEAARAGVGAGRAEGFGEILIEPAFLETVPERSGTQKPQKVMPEEPKDAAFAWAKARSVTERSETDDLQFIRTTLDRFEDLYTQAYDEAVSAKMPFKSVAPNRAQWGEIRRLARQHRTAEALTRVLFGEKEGVTRGSQAARAWSFTGEDKDGRPISFHSLLERFVEDARARRDEGSLARLVEMLATEMPRRIDAVAKEPS